MPVSKGALRGQNAARCAPDIRRAARRRLSVCLFSRWGQQPDPRVLANPLVKQTLKVDPSTWQASAALSPEVRAKVEATLARQRALKAARAGQEVKVGSLLRAYQRAAATAEPTPAGRIRAMRSRLPISASSRTARCARASTCAAARCRSAIRALGVRIARVSEDRRVLYAALSAAEIDRVAAQAVVAKISPIVGAKVNAGSVLSEGVAALRADRVQAQLRVTGKKIRIGVISDGIESIAAPAATGDIPATGAGLPKVELCPLNDNSGDEGTAMLEIVHDMAPSAALAFCPAFGDTGQQGLADAVTWLATQAFGGKGADVIVDDVGYLTEPFFQDGVIAQAVDAAVAHGVSYLSSAGNSADAHYEHVYQRHRAWRRLQFPARHARFGSVAGLVPDIGWDGVVAGNGNFFAAFMQWNDPFGGSANDYDIYIFDVDGISPAIRPAISAGAPGVDAQDGNDDPMEVAFVVNEFPGPTLGTIKGFFMVIDRFFADHEAAGAALQRVLRGRPGQEHRRGQHLRPRRQPRRDGRRRHRRGREHRRHAEPGPRRHRGVQLARPVADLFTPAGALAPEVRRKPNTTAVDGTSVTGVNFFTPFFGTSASAPHAAAVAVLLKDVDPGLGPAGSRASCARRRSSAARPASTRPGASV